jgi:cytochrome P450
VTPSIRDAPPLRGALDIEDYQEISEILRSPHFDNASLPIGHSQMIPGALTTLDGAEHFARRRLESRLFSGSALQHYDAVALTPTIERCLAGMRKQRSSTGVVHADLVPLIWRMAHQIPATMVGIDDVDSIERTDQFIDCMRRISKATGVDWSVVSQEEVLAAGNAALSQLRTEFFEPSVARRREMIRAFENDELAEDSLPQDLITLLLRNWQPHWAPTVLLSEVSHFINGSVSTTTQAFPRFVVQLSGWLAEHPHHRELVHDIGFLQRAVYESLRLFVASPARMRIATADVVLKSGRTIARGQRVALWFLPADMQTEQFGPDAASFNPLREVQGRAAWGLAFGGGAHMCIGKPMVTGVSSRREDATGAAKYGSMATIAAALFGAGMMLDPDRPPVINEATFYTEYSSLGVIFTQL